MFLALSPCAFIRAWVAVGKPFAMASWQVAHSSEPTNSAPGMLGGARIARVDSKLLQERRMTVNAAPPPTVHRSLSRLPVTHRVSLECRTTRTVAKTVRGCLRIFTGKSLPLLKEDHLILLFCRLRAAAR